MPSIDLPMVSCQVFEIEQVLTNLIINARDAMKTALVKKLTLRSFKQGNFVVVEVEDTGEGVPKKLQAQIFDSFFTTKEVGKGTGLGLSICASIIKNHNGSIEVESEEGKGSLFRIKLPIPTSNR